MQTKFDEAQKAYYEKFGELIPILFGVDDEDYKTEEFIALIYKAIEDEDISLVLKEYEVEDVDY